MTTPRAQAAPASAIRSGSNRRVNSKIRCAGDWASRIRIQDDGEVIENTEITGNYTAIRINNSSGHRGQCR